MKVSGVRVEPEEIEAVLSGHPRVRAAAVAAHTGGPGAARLVAFVVGQPNQTGQPGQAAPEPADLRAFLSERLPGQECWVPNVRAMTTRHASFPSMRRRGDTVRMVRKNRSCR